MQINSNGIRVVTPKKKQLRKPLEYALDTVTFWREERGQIITIIVPKFSPLFTSLKEDGWRKMK